ncbi:CDP-diacylglycerol--glycerol-3-phosphate 3-phosphatidyltransferase [Haloimpatiens sp. FM7330]|uniref:CDP-diacylglycerol--glycerol-3-phosphate 3-phosphatidyltransferase n=1 Tax=Haloimpatiens sp. FM7330 TaxID=3298610 RepID=UPI003633F4E8
MNIPNVLTLIRFFLIPFFILVFFSTTNNSLLYSILIFLTAGFTDILDGYLARKYNLITKWGIVMDPLADKLMLITVLTCLVIKNYIPLWVLLIIIFKELAMIVGGTLLYNKDMVIPSNTFGKLSTFLFYISIFTLTFNEILGKLLIYISVISALIAFVNYLVLYNRKLKN